MALTEQKSVDKIEVIETGAVLVREVTRMLRDDKIIAHTFHRWSFEPGSDVSHMPDSVQAIANAAWTAEVVDTYQQRMSQAV